MWANSVWGFFATAFACFLARLGVNNPLILWWLNAGIYVFVSLGTLVLFFPSGRKYITKKFKPNALEIFFDPNNPAKRFWSLDNVTFQCRGDAIVKTMWRYRVEIRNLTNKTIRNVRVTAENIGPMPHRPVLMNFEINEATAHDIQPGQPVLVGVVQWDNPVIMPGLIGGEAYGPIKIIASGDDVPAVERIFRFDYQRTPMLYD